MAPAPLPSVYGMNTAPQRGFHRAFGRPLSPAGMALACITLYFVSRRNNWL